MKIRGIRGKDARERRRLHLRSRASKTRLFPCTRDERGSFSRLL